MINFYRDKDIDMLKLGCTFPNLANICLHKSTDAHFYPFTERDKDILEKTREDVVGGPSIVLTREAVVDETFIRKSTNLLKSNVGIDASQLYPYSMPTGLYMRWDFDSETSRIIPRQNQARIFENMVMSHFQRTRPECETESFFTTGRQKKLTASVLMALVLTATLFETMGCFYQFCPVKSCVPLPVHRDYTKNKKKVSRLMKCGSTNGGDCTKHPILLNNISENTFLKDVHLQLSNF